MSLFLGRSMCIYQSLIDWYWQDCRRVAVVGANARRKGIGWYSHKNGRPRAAKKESGRGAGSVRGVEAENPGVVAIVGAHILAVWAGCVDVAYGEWRMIIGFVGGGMKVDVALHEVGGVANNGFGRFLGDRAWGINVGKVVVVGTEYAAGHTFVFVVAQTSVNLYRNGLLDECGGRCDFFLEGFGT